MKRRLLPAVGGIVAGVAVIAPAPASAARFTPPVRLPGKPAHWRFAINDRGQAVALAGDAVYPIAASGALGAPWKIQIPGAVAIESGNIALDDQGHVAVGIEYDDGEYAGAQENHGAPPCCGQIAVDAWTLGSAPPAPQTFVVRESPQREEQIQALEPPVLLLQSDGVTALWPRGEQGTCQLSGDCTARVEAASGAIGGPLHGTILGPVAQSEGVASLALTAGSGGGSLAAWVKAPDEVVRARSSDASVPLRTVGVQRIAGLEPAGIGQTGLGFSSDGSGSILLSFVRARLGSHQSLELSESRGGARFGRPHSVLRQSPFGKDSGGDENVLLGAGGTVVVISGTAVRVGRLHGGLGPVRYFGGEWDLGWPLAGGRAVVISEMPARRGKRLAARLLSAHGTERSWRNATPSLSGRPCLLDLEAQNEPPIASNRAGGAIFDVGCEGPNYLIRFSP